MTPSNTKNETLDKPKVTEKAKVPTPKNSVNYKKAVDLGKKLSKNPDTTKIDVATKMYDLVKDEAREVISMAFIEGANLTPKGSMTYVYNIRRKMKKLA